jgi:putative transposase
MSERLQFIERLLAGERMSDLCREFGISRQTGYKFRERFEREQLAGLEDRSRAPRRVANRTDDALRELLIGARREHPTWGPRKLCAWLAGKHPGLRLPAASTVGDLLKRQGLVQPRRRCRRTPLQGTALTQATAPNEVWCADFKGQFRLGNGQYCYPLTITDRYSRCILGIEALESTEHKSARTAFEVAFQHFGLPRIIRTDNGAPFASRGLLGLSRLSAWWRQHGVRHERIEPAHPQQNGQHERMHLTLKQETTRPAAANFLQQQERFDRFIQQYNEERPHEALGQKPPATYFTTSERRYDPSTSLSYPLHDCVRRVSPSGHIGTGARNRHVFLSSALASLSVGTREIDHDLWLVSFADLDLGTIDVRGCRFMPADVHGHLQDTGS